MYATVAQQLRDVNVSKENRGPLDEAAAPWVTKARDAYTACSKAATGGEATIFSKSCNAWLQANP